MFIINYYFWVIVSRKKNCQQPLNQMIRVVCCRNESLGSILSNFILFSQLSKK